MMYEKQPSITIRLDVVAAFLLIVCISLHEADGQSAGRTCSEVFDSPGGNAVDTIPCGSCVEVFIEPYQVGPETYYKLATTNSYINKSSVLLLGDPGYSCDASETTQSSSMKTLMSTMETLYEPKKRVCYFTNWSQYRSGNGAFSVDDIDAHLCTHIMYSFAKLEATSTAYTLAPFEWNDISAQYPAVMALKNTNPDLKVLLAVGGWTHGTSTFEDMASNSAKRSEFINNAVSFLKLHGFDGLDYDWEFPVGYMQQFSDLIVETKAAFESEGLLVTAAVSGSKNIIDEAYDMQLLSEHLDFINLMTYDFHGAWPGETVTGHNSPLYGRSGETGNDIYTNQDYAVNYWLAGNADPKKLVMGLAVFGRSFTLADSSNNGLGAPFTGKGSSAPYTAETGYIGYFEMCEKLSSGWTRVWDDEHKVPYAFSGNQWISYDDEESFTIKAKYIIDKGLGGSMVWAIDLDDFTDSGIFCGNGKYPLLNILKDSLNNGSSTPIPTPASPSSSSAEPGGGLPAPTTQNPGVFQCPTPNGIFPTLDVSCRHYYECNHNIPYLMTCHEANVFNPNLLVCDWPENVPSCNTN